MSASIKRLVTWVNNTNISALKYFLYQLDGFLNLLISGRHQLPLLRRKDRGFGLFGGWQIMTGTNLIKALFCLDSLSFDFIFQWGVFSIKSKSFEQLPQLQSDFQYQRWEISFFIIFYTVEKPIHKSLKDFIRPFDEVFSVEKRGINFL